LHLEIEKKLWTIFPRNDLFLTFYSDNKFDISKSFEKKNAFISSVRSHIYIKKYFCQEAYILSLTNVAETAKIKGCYFSSFWNLCQSLEKILETSKLNI